MSAAPRVSAALALAAALGASAPIPDAGHAVSAQLERFAQSQVDAQFLREGDVLITACPYALGSYVYIELSGIRRSQRSLSPEEERGAGVGAVRELIVRAKRARLYWSPGKCWIVSAQAPALRFYAEEGAEGWRFRADDHICARGEPQRKPAEGDVPR